jgi:hypothetical protein
LISIGGPSDLRELAEALGLITPATAGLTIGHGIFVRQECLKDPKLIVHELMHVGQYQRHGSVLAFLQQSLSEVNEYGYPAAPMEKEAKPKRPCCPSSAPPGDHLASGWRGSRQRSRTDRQAAVCPISCGKFAPKRNAWPIHRTPAISSKSPRVRPSSFDRRNSSHPNITSPDFDSDDLDSNGAALEHWRWQRG